MQQRIPLSRAPHLGRLPCDAKPETRPSAQRASDSALATERRESRGNVTATHRLRKPAMTRELDYHRKPRSPRGPWLGDEYCSTQVRYSLHRVPQTEPSEHAPLPIPDRTDQAECCIQCSCVCVCRCVTVCGQWTYSHIICMSVDFCCVDCYGMLSVMTV